MNTYDSTISYEALIWRYLAGEATRDEVTCLTTWLKSNDDNKADFHRIKELYFRTKHAAQRNKFDASVAFSQFEKATQPVAKQHFLRPWTIGAAAAVLILLVGGVWFWNNTQNNSTTNDIVYAFLPQKNQFNLPDNSTVLVNRHSAVTYKMAETHKRVTQLQGEAFFEVTHNAQKPFEVYTEKLKIRVLGTSFNVNAHNLDSIVVSVSTGRVMVQSVADSSDVAIITAGQSVCFWHGKLLSVEKNADNTFAWQNRKLQFNATPLKKVVSTLNSYFDTTIEMGSVDGSQQLTVQLTNPQLDSVLQLLEVMYHLKTTRKDNRIVLDSEPN